MNTEDQARISAKMQKALDFFQNEINQIRTGRASSSLVENIIVDAYEGTQKLKIKEMGAISTPDARTIVIEVWDGAVLPEIEKAISQGLNLSCQVNDNFIRVFLPSLTEERRREFVRALKQKTEMAKIAIRQERADAIRDLKRALNDKQINEDEEERGEKEVQKLTDSFVEKIEFLSQKKEEEIMSI